MLITSAELVNVLEGIEELTDELIQVLRCYKRPALVHEHFDNLGEPIAFVNYADEMQSWVEWEEYDSGQTLMAEYESMAVEVESAEIVPVILHTLAVAARVRQLHPTELEKDIQELSTCLQDEPICSVLPDNDLRQMLERLVSSIGGQSHHEQPTILEPPSLNEFSEELMALLAQKPELMFRTHPIVFERVVAAIFERFDMKVALTQQTCDGGYDIIACEESRFTKNQYIIEVKRFQPTKKVGLGLVQRLYGVKTANAATKAFLVTSSSFSAQARKFARQHTWEVDLKDYRDLVEWLRFHWGNRAG